MGLVIGILVAAAVIALIAVMFSGLMWLLGVALALVLGAAVIGWARGTSQSHA